jgi:hypothetical protein
MVFGITPRSARRTRRSHNTHSGSSLSSSSLRGDDLHTVDTTEQVPGVGGGAKRCYPHTPFARFRQLVARLRRRIRHDPPRPRLASYETHSRTRVGGWVLRSGCADPVPARSPAQGPRARPKGRPPPPLRAPSSPALPNASDCRADKRGSSRTRRNLPSDSLNLTQAGRHASAALILPPPPPLGTSPPLDSRRTGCSAERDPRHAKGRGARAAPHAALRAPYQAFTQHTLG